MADLDSNRFFCLGNIPDDSGFVHQAMDKLGFACEFYELPIADMQLALALALHIKRTQGEPERWES
ncbi:MAG: hypothetical protein ACJ72H_25510 [Candidatus Sulfotelmatobacter sp.]